MILPLAVLALAASGHHHHVIEHPPVGCRTIACERRVAQRQQRVKVRVIHRQRRAVIAPFIGWLASTRMCESGGNYKTNTGNGFFGAYQFTIESWRAVGGEGLPSDAGRLEQDYRAILLRRIQGTGAWPVCGH